MLHSRKDYAHIQDPSGKIPENEPVMLFRGQDKHAPAQLEAYADQVEEAEGDPSIVGSARRQAARMREWQATVGKKAPDMLQENVLVGKDGS